MAAVTWLEAEVVQNRQFIATELYGSPNMVNIEDILA